MERKEARAEINRVLAIVAFVAIVAAAIWLMVSAHEQQRRDEADFAKSRAENQRLIEEAERLTGHLEPGGANH